jgi:hypothetical protein
LNAKYSAKAATQIPCLPGIGELSHEAESHPALSADPSEPAAVYNYSSMLKSESHAIEEWELSYYPEDICSSIVESNVLTQGKGSIDSTPSSFRYSGSSNSRSRRLRLLSPRKDKEFFAEEDGKLKSSYGNATRPPQN